ncbi:MAG TPA: RNA-binding protein [Ignavibacteriales bacterium]|nr:RNA-binding protein [Ignavibacteriales bacterium]
MNLFVGNLDFKVKSNYLAELFGQYGKVTSARVITDKETGRSRGFGFVEMENESEAKSAIEKLNGTDFRNRSISVNEARPKETSNRTYSR